MKKYFAFIYSYINFLFPGSNKYWNIRYRAWGSSWSGSYWRLAHFKANFLNKFCQENHINMVIEFGCGDGHQLSLWKYKNYVGFDISQKAIQLCKKIFLFDQSKSFFLFEPGAFLDNLRLFRGDLSLSIDVLYHLVEDEVFFDYMHILFSTSNQFVIIYSSNFDSPVKFHQKDRNFTTFITNQFPNWTLVDQIQNQFPYDSKNPYNSSKCDFFVYKKIT